MDLGEERDGGVEVGKVMGNVALLIAAFSEIAGACTIIGPPSRPVGQSFQVKVEDRGRPVKGLKLVLSPDGKVSAITGPDGIARFQAVAPGSYYVSAIVDTNMPSTVHLQVSANGPRGVQIPLKWPSVAPIPVRSLRGSIRGPIFNPRGPQPKANVDLMEAKSGNVLRSFQTSGWGEFDLADVGPGLYFLVLRGFDPPISVPPAETGVISVEVGENALADRMTVDVGYTSCGLFYKNSAECPRSTLTVSRLAGRVEDVTGGSIRQASVFVYDSSANLVEELKANDSGEFSAALVSQGTFEIVAQSTGFTPLRTSVQLLPASVPASASPLTLQLGILGSCSTVKMQ